MGSRTTLCTDSVIPLLRPIRVGEINDLWALDLQGLFPVRHTKNPCTVADKDSPAATTDHYAYVAVFTEFFTRFAVTTPLRTRKAAEIAQAFLDNIVFVFGPCRELMLECSIR